MEGHQNQIHMTSSETGALIAIVGVDGSGKSTLAPMLVEAVDKYRPAQSCYLGLGSAGMREKIASFGPSGRWLASKLVKRAEQSKDKSKKIPGLGTALGSYWLTLRRVERFYQAQDLKKQGVVVVTDRYPQNEVMGIYDGPILSAARAEGMIVKRLARKERQHYEAMAAVRPELVIKLKVDVDTALRRSPNHMRHDIERKAQACADLTFNNAQIVEVDANKPLDQVFAEVKSIAFEKLGISAK